MTDEENKDKVLTLQDVIDETAKPILIPIPAAKGSIKYIRPTDEEAKELRERVDTEVKVLRERDRLDCYDSKGNPIAGKVPTPENVIQQKANDLLAELLLWKGLNKADESVTEAQIKKMSQDVKAQINIYLTKVTYSDVLSEEEVSGLKNLLELTKA